MKLSEVPMGTKIRIVDSGVEPNPFIVEGVVDSRDGKGTVSIVGIPVCDCCRKSSNVPTVHTYWEDFDYDLSFEIL